MEGAGRSQGHSPGDSLTGASPPAASSQHNSNSNRNSSGNTAAGAQGQPGVSGSDSERLDEASEQRQELAEDVAAVGSPGQQLAVKKGQDQLEKKARGTVFLEVTYIPFKQPDAAIPATAAGGAPATAPYLDPFTATAAATTPAPQLARAAGVHLGNRRGILSVTVLRATGLMGWVGEPDPYVALELLEPDGGPTQRGAAAGAGAEAGAGPGFWAGGAQQQKHVTSVMFNEDHPRWNETFDFIMVSASSKLLLTLWDKVTLAEIATSLKVKDRFKDHVLGRVKVEVADVAGAGRLRLGYPLQGALMGHLELVMQWIPAELAM